MNLKNFTAKISLKIIACKYFMKNFLNLCKIFINNSSINRFKLLIYNNIQPQYKMQKNRPTPACISLYVYAMSATSHCCVCDKADCPIA